MIVLRTLLAGFCAAAIGSVTLAAANAQSGAQGTGEPQTASQVDAGVRFAIFLDAARADAEARGIRREIIERAFKDLTFDPEIAQFETQQAEFIRTAADYLALIVSPSRVATGREMLERHAATLEAIERRFGVERHIVLAIWGIETSFGANPGDRLVIRSLATLASLDGRRGAFWRGELQAALRLMDRGDAPLDEWRGSWAGASGHTQFMPSTLLRHGFDFEGDGRIDIWTNPADALASAAGYLKASGWVEGVPPAVEASLPQLFEYALAAPDVSRTRRAWEDAGVVFRGERVPAQASGSLLLPAGHRGPAFLVTANFQAILKYNNATLYALAVAQLADRIAGREAQAAAWPEGDRMLARAEREELQRLLSAAGQDVGAVDGIIGIRTRAAIRAVQKVLGLPADGHPNGELLDALRKRGN